MQCEVYDRLQRDWKSAQEEWAYFAYPQNKALRGRQEVEAVSERSEGKDERSLSSQGSPL